MSQVDELRYPGVAAGETDLSIVIVNFRTAEHVSVCLTALAREREHDGAFDVTVVDGGSGDGSADRISAFIDRHDYDGWVGVLPLECNGGFGWANNQAIRHLAQRAKPPRFILLLNPDAVPEPGAVRALYEVLNATPEAASAGSLLVTLNGELQGSAFTFPTVRSEFFRGSGVAWLARIFGVTSLISGQSVVPAEWVTGASVMFRMDALNDVGLFDEGFFLYYEEVELMHRLHSAGWLALHVPASRVVHIGGVSTGVADGASRQRRLPDYWFRSRRRYFALTRGRSATALASIAWLLGSALGRLRLALSVGRESTRPPHELRDFLRHGITANSEDLTPAVPTLDSPVDQPPAWMIWKDQATVINRSDNEAQPA